MVPISQSPIPGIGFMSKTILLEVTHPTLAAGKIEGFRFLWAYYVDGYRSDKHCQPCFYGELDQEFATNTASSGVVVDLDKMDRYPYVYICGVASGPKSELWHRNLHMPLEYAEGEVAEATTYNGYHFRATNASRIRIPCLQDGWNGLPTEQTRCKNFQFAVSKFGYPSPPREQESALTKD